MVIVKLKYIKSLEVIDEHLQQHRAFLKKQYDAGILLASGPMNPRTGGIIISLLDKLNTEMILKEDPFLINAVATYSLIEFEPILHNAALKPLLSNLSNEVV